MSDSFGVVILAAGLSSRMGSPKPLLELGNKTFLDHMFLNHIFSRPSIESFIVLGHEKDQIIPNIPDFVRIVENPDYQSGRTTSVQHGIRSLTVQVSGAFIWPVDCPLVPVHVFDTLTESIDSNKQICIPSYQFKRGHPPLIGSHFFPTILAMQPDEPLRNIYRKYQDKLIHCTVDTESILHNVNTPADYQQIQNYFEQHCD